jgi:archaellum biogenesis protein FlaJ (TadC family)
MAVRLGSMKKRQIALILVINILVSAYLVVRGDVVSLIAVNAVAGTVVFLLFYIRKRIPTRIDQQLVSLLIHMYAVSHGEITPDDLVKIIAETKDYGYYSEIFSGIRKLAKEYGYGITKATSEMANTTKAPFKDVLIRCLQAFSSTHPKGYLELESSTMIEEYSGYYDRAIKSIDMLGGVYSTFSSVSTFLIMILDILVVFTNEPNLVYFGYFVASAVLIVMYLGLRTVVPKDVLIHIDKDMPPKLYTRFRVALPIAFACIVPAVLVSIIFGYPYGFFVCGLAFLLPGYFAYRFETFVIGVNENYPTLIKGLGENMASSSSLQNALSYVLYLELGRLKDLLKRAYARVKIGVDNAKTLSLLSSEAASHTVYMTNKIFLDAFNYGADLLEVGKILGNNCVKNLEFRKKREAVVKTIETTTFLLQPITVALLTILTFMTKYFSQTLTSVPYFTFGSIPTDVINMGNVFMILLITILNSLTLKEARGGFWGSSLMYAGILLILSGAAWIGAQTMMNVSFGGAFGNLQQIVAPTG